jgi:striatin 1/3/4
VPTNVVHQAPVEEQDHLIQNHQLQNHVSPQSLEEMYAQQQRSKEANHVSMMNQPATNHQAPSVVPRVSELPSLSRPSQSSDQPGFNTRSNDAQGMSPGSQLGPADNRTTYEFPTANDEPVERVTHSYDAYGQQVPSRVEETTGRVSEETNAADTDGWNFEDSMEPPHEDPPSEYAHTQRPDTDAFPSAQNLSLKTSPRAGGGPGSRRKSSISKRRQSDGSHELRELSLSQGGGMTRGDTSSFKVRFACRGHLDVVRSVIFTGGGTPAEPEICTTGDDGVIKRWIIPATYGSFGPHGGATTNDLDISSYFTHRGHSGAVMCLAASPASQNFLNGGRAIGDGWVFSGGQDASIRVWERGRVDPKATMDGHTDAVWTICVLPGSSASILGDQSSRHGGADRMMLASGAADGTILIWAVSSPPQLTSPSTGSRRGAGGSRRANSVSSGSNFPSSPQPSTATSTPFHYSLVHRIERLDHPSPTWICPLSMSGDNFVVSYNDASVLIYDTRTAEEIVGMASQETYDKTRDSGVNAVAATKAGLDSHEANRSTEDEGIVHGATGSSSGVEGMILSGHEDRYIRFFDANSGEYSLVQNLTQNLLHCRPMYVYHARPSLRHCLAFSFS